MTHKTEVFLTIPKIEDLVCVNCKVNPSDTQDPLIKSLFHCQILTCRLIIYTVRCCIAAPSIQNVEDSIHVIVSKEFYCTEKLQQHLQNLKVQFTDPEPVHPKIYEACLKYTFTFKLAPLWNAVGKAYYIRGFNFLSLPTNAAALQWNIIMKDNNTKLEIIPMKLNLSPIHLESLSLPSNAVDYFLNDSNCEIDIIDLSSFQISSVYVLPKLTRARIVSVSKTLPKSCPFKSYNDLRRHWKNMYSYRLPKSDQGMLFYEVVFSVNPDQCLTYPEMCLLSKMPEILMCENKNEIASDFIKDLTTNVHSICGQVIHIGHQYPKIDVEYSCTFKRKTFDSQHMFSDLTSPFFKNAKITNEKLNLSSLFTKDKLDRMRSPMRDHTQKVLSIMGNKKKKKISVNDQYSQFPPLIMSKGRAKKAENEYIPMEPGSPLNFKIEDVLSYYDIPSMNPEAKSNSNNTSSRNHEFSNASEIPRNVPVIKNIRQVNYDLSEINKMRSNNGISQLKETLNHQESSTLLSNDGCRNWNRATSNLEECRLSQSNLHNPSSGILKKKFTAMEDSNKMELTDDQFRSMLAKFDEYNHDGRHTDDVEKMIYEQCSSSNAAKSKISSKKVPEDLELTFPFGFENPTPHTPEELKIDLKTTSTPISANNKNSYDFRGGSPSSLSSKQRTNSLKEKSEQLNYSYDNYGKNQTDSFHSNFSRITENGSWMSKNNEFSTADRDKNHQPVPPIDSSSKCNHARNNSSSNQSTGQSPFITLNLNKVSDKRENESFEQKLKLNFDEDQRNLFDVSQISVSTVDRFEGSINRKLLQKCKSPITIHNSRRAKETSEELTNEMAGNQDEYNQDRFYETQFSPSIFETSGNKIDAPENTNVSPSKYNSKDSTGNVLSHNEKDSCGTPSLISMNTEYSKKHTTSSAGNFEFYNQLQKEEISELASSKMEQDGDFLSILSQSSNESNSVDYDSYKYAFTEALTFN